MEGDSTSLWWMKTSSTFRFSRRHRRAAHGSALWVPLLAGLFLMLLAAAARGDAGFQARRTESFSATLSAGSTIRIENVSGDIVAKPGRQFSASVVITGTARTQARADEVVRATTVSQSRDGDEYAVATLWPLRERGHRPRALLDSQTRLLRHGELRCEDCKITARYEVSVPAGVRAILHTVSGEIRTDGLEDELDLQTVNGGVAVRGARKSVTAQSVNGRVDVEAQALPVSASLDLKTVNGALVLTLPKDARFQLSASSMNGSIASTFPLPPRAESEDDPAARRPPSPRRPRAPRPVVEPDDEDQVVVDLHQLEKELEESMKEIDVEVRESLRGVDRQMRQWKLSLGGQYNGSIGQGGARVHLSTLNGSIRVLASGTKESEAKTLVSPRRSFSVEVPRVVVRVPPVEVRPRAIVRVAPKIAGEDEEVVRGDIAGDFLATTGSGGYRIGRVSGRVKILTQAGEIHVASAGAGAELKTYGGDITVGAVHGDLKALTFAGDIHAGAVTGSATVETTGGDVRVERVGGPADIRTGGGDLVLEGVAAGLQARSGGGDMKIVLSSRDLHGGVSVRNAGGDVTLTLPSDARADVELAVSDCADSSETFIRSDFPEISVVRRNDSTRASGAINGGGARVTIHTSSGTIRVRKGPPAGGQ